MKTAVYFSVGHDQDVRRRASAHMKLWSMSSTFAAVYRVFWGRMLELFWYYVGVVGIVFREHFLGLCWSYLEVVGIVLELFRKYFWGRWNFSGTLSELFWNSLGVVETFWALFGNHFGVVGTSGN